MKDIAQANAPWNDLLETIGETKRKMRGEEALLLGFARKIEDLAFQMEAPNAYTPRFMEIAIAMRLAAKSIRDW